MGFDLHPHTQNPLNSFLWKNWPQHSVWRLPCFSEVQEIVRVLIIKRVLMLQTWRLRNCSAWTYTSCGTGDADHRIHRICTLLDVVHIRFPRIQPFLRNDFTPRIALLTMEFKDHSRLCEVWDFTDSDRGLGDSHDPSLLKIDQTFEFRDLTFKDNWTWHWIGNTEFRRNFLEQIANRIERL